LGNWRISPSTVTYVYTSTLEPLLAGIVIVLAATVGVCDKPRARGKAGAGRFGLGIATNELESVADTAVGREFGASLAGTKARSS